MMTELAQPVKLVARWPRHGDLTVLVDGRYVYLRADDVERLAGIPAWADDETMLGDEWPADLDGVAFYHVEAALEKVRRQASPETAAAFLAWLDSVMPDLLDPDTIDSARPTRSFVHGVTVQHAARKLTDAGIRVGRAGLFTTLERLGWTIRDGDHWGLTTLPVERGWATVRTIPHPDRSRGRGAGYPQIYILPEGLAELVARLAAPAAPTDPRPVHDHVLPLFDTVDGNRR